MDLFKHAEDTMIEAGAPLAVRMRPRTIDEVAGQQEFLGPGRMLRRMLQAGRISSLVFYGPPGTGKTTLARVIANDCRCDFYTLNAASASVKDVREILARARDTLTTVGRKTVLFIDELHRFNRAQQDVLLSDVENGVIILIGATTENPFFSINSPLLSRSTVFQFQPLSEQDVVSLLRRALADHDRGLGRYQVQATDEALEHLARISDGDARRALTALEVGVLSQVNAVGLAGLAEPGSTVGLAGSGPSGQVLRAGPPQTPDQGPGAGSQNPEDQPPASGGMASPVPRGGHGTAPTQKPSTVGLAGSGPSGQVLRAGPPQTPDQGPGAGNQNPEDQPPASGGMASPVPRGGHGTAPTLGPSVLFDLTVAQESIQAKAVQYDAAGDQHYDAISAFIKSMRGSDPDAAAYWLAKMLVAGEDPRFIARRIAILASEDIGNADPRALSVAAAAYDVVERIGLPECQLTLAQAAIYMACAPKSNASAMAIWQATDDVKGNRTIPVPKHLRNAPHPGMKEQFGYSEGYQYSHSFAGGVSPDQDYLGVDKTYYNPTDRGYEKHITAYLEWVKQLKSKPVPPQP